MSYTHATIPSDTDSTLPQAHQPGESAAATLTRAIVTHLEPHLWVPDLGWDTNGMIATARITIAAAAVRVPVTLTWRAAQFTLTIDGRRDPLHHSRLAHRAEYLATLSTDSTATTLAELVDQQIAERLAATIVYAGLHIACERVGADPALLAYQCAQCGDIDFTAAAGGETTIDRHRCPVCRGVTAPLAPVTVSTPRARRHRRPRPAQEELLDVHALPVSCVQQHHGPLADWPQHRLLQQITQDRFTTWQDALYEVTVDEHGNHHTTPADPRDTELIEQLRTAGLVNVRLWLFADVDGHYRETRPLSLSRAGWTLLRRWADLRAPTAR